MTFFPIKLVRDVVGAKPAAHATRSMINDMDGIRLLRRKLLEEAIEYLENPSWGELADVAEIVDTLAAYDPALGAVPKHEGGIALSRARALKNARSGSFLGLTVLGIEADD